jgi:division protein CdvB (Snf7/Vps24/ESCRT-III family)
MSEMDLFDKMKKGISDAGAKAKDMVEITRLNNQIGQRQRDIEQVYNKIGQAVFKAFQDNTLLEIEEAIKDFSQEIVQKQQEIAELESNITENKSTDTNAPYVPETQSPETRGDQDPDQKVCPTCGQVSASETKFCPACGNKF